MNNTEYWYWLNNIESIFWGKINKLIKNFGSPWEIYKAKETDLKHVDGITPADIDKIINSRKDFEKIKELDDLYDQGIMFLFPGHPAYPERLMKIESKPYCLYVKGRLPADNIPTVGMIGARNCSNYGRHCAQMISEEISQENVQIISGLARGIDSICGKAAIESGGVSFGILGCGIDVIYPPENRGLFEITIEKGGIITEYPLKTKPLPAFFPQRNRLISGLSDCIAVIEAKEKSGSLITVEYALEQGKDVFAVPGRITDISSNACNRLISEGAGILREGNDLLNNLGIFSENSVTKAKKTKFSIAKDFELLYSCVEFHPKTAEEIIFESGSGYKNGIKNLIQLELDGLIYSPAPNYYSRT